MVGNVAEGVGWEVAANPLDPHASLDVDTSGLLGDGVLELLED